MHDTDDIELLRRYAEEQSETAFETLVKRHVNLVYSAARRSVDDAHQAEEITQAVFIILARKAGNLRQGTILSGWLYQTARLTAANHLRAEIRRAHREKEAHMQSLLNETDPDPWPQIAPLLEQAVGALGEKDRNAIVLRFFEKKNLSEVGRAFGTSEDAAKMRVNRALEKLHKFFTKRGITLSATVLSGVVSANSVQAAPMELATTIAATAVKGSAVAVPILTLVKGTLKLMAWTKVKAAIAVGVGVLLVGGSTGTLVFKKWEAYQAYRDSWRTAGLDSGTVERALPQVRILSTKYAPPTHNLAQTASGDRWGGIGVSAGEIVWAAYDWRPARIVFAKGPPAERYDFMANLPQGAAAILQKELKRRLAWSVAANRGRWTYCCSKSKRRTPLDWSRPIPRAEATTPIQDGITAMIARYPIPILRTSDSHASWKASSGNPSSIKPARRNTSASTSDGLREPRDRARR